MLSIILLKLERFYRENEVSSVTRTARTIRADQLKLISEQRISSAAHPFAHARDSTSKKENMPTGCEVFPIPVLTDYSCLAGSLL
jgi:hypothetical protein